MANRTVEQWEVNVKGVYRSKYFVINPENKVVRAPAYVKWDKKEPLVLNGVDLGVPTKITKAGVARWEDVPPVDIASILNFEVEDEPTEKVTIVPDSVDPKLAGDPNFNLSVPKKMWLDKDRWLAHVQVSKTNDESNGILTSMNRSDNSNGFMPFFITGKPDPDNPEIKVGKVSLKMSDETESITVAFKLRDTKGKPYTEAKQVVIPRPPLSEQPDKEDFWASRRVDTEPENRSPDFDPSYLDMFPKYAIHKGKEYYWYRDGDKAVNLDVDTVPGGFTVKWEWEKSNVTMPGGKPMSAKFARTYFRPTAFRGSGKPWITSCNSKHLKPNPVDPIIIPVMESQASPGELIDVLIIPQGYWNHYHEMSEIVTINVGPKPDMGKGIPNLGMEVYSYMRFPENNPPISKDDYEALKREISGSSYRSDKQPDPRTFLKNRIANEGKVLSVSEVRNLYKEELPKFTFLSDNFGKFNALPQGLWDEIIEYTDTNNLVYDSLWFSCADFATDFKSEAARLGAKVANIWDFSGGHAYCSLLVLDGDGNVRIEFFEPQTDGFVEEGKGMYSQKSEGIIMAW